jgi:hypothetical protein
MLNEAERAVLRARDNLSGAKSALHEALEEEGMLD